MPALRGEESIVQGYLAPLAAGFAGAYGLADDCAAFAPTPGCDIVMKTDPVAEGVHFLADDAPEDIAWKALAVNVSDLAAKGATPRVYLMALSFPAAPEAAWMARFAAGLAAAQSAFGIMLAGGDTDRRPGPLSISMTVFGEVPSGRMVRRAGARPGDVLFVTGTLGDAALGLRIRQDASLAGRLRLDATEAAGLVDRYLRPRPRLAMRDALLSSAHAAMDLSDGLAKDLGRMCGASAAMLNGAGASPLGAIVEIGLLPTSPAFDKALAADPGLIDAALGAGDDYELLIAVPPARAAAFVAAVAGLEFPVTEIGVMTAADGAVFRRADGTCHVPRIAGWDHF